MEGTEYVLAIGGGVKQPTNKNTYPHIPNHNDIFHQDRLSFVKRCRELSAIVKIVNESENGGRAKYTHRLRVNPQRSDFLLNRKKRRFCVWRESPTGV